MRGAWAIVFLLIAGPAGAEERPCQSAEWRATRERAVWRGTRWMAEFLARPGRVRALGSDAPSSLVELATTADAELRRFVLEHAQRAARRLFARLGSLRDHDALMNAIWLLAHASELGERYDGLLARVTARLRALRTPEAVYDVRSLAPGAFDSEDVFSVLLDAYMLERARLAHPELPATTFGLREALAAVGRWRYLPHAEDRSKDRERFEDDAYLATHVAFVLNDYGRYALDLGHLPRSWAFLRAHMGTLRKEQHIDLVSEILDVSHAAGEEDAATCEAERWLVGIQNADGSWGSWRREKDLYDAMHPTWTALGALRVRVPLPESAMARRVAEIVKGVRGL